LEQLAARCYWGSNKGCSSLPQCSSHSICLQIFL